MVVNTQSRKDFIKEVRLHSKKIMTLVMGGRCCICGYKKCTQALEFHHINPDEKDFHFNKIVITKKSWSKICNELRKCVMLCANCHREIHSGSASIPDNASRFNEEYAEYESTRVHGEMDECPICSGPKIAYNKTCSNSCAAKYNTGKINWDEVDLKTMLDSGMSYYKISDLLGISPGTIHKRANKLGLKSKASITND